MGETNGFMGYISLLYTVGTQSPLCYICNFYFSVAKLFYFSEHSKNLLVECAASHLKHKKTAATYGSRLDSSSGRILLQSVPGIDHGII